VDLFVQNFDLVSFLDVQGFGTDLSDLIPELLFLVTFFGLVELVFAALVDDHWFLVFLGDDDDPADLPDVLFVLDVSLVDQLGSPFEEKLLFGDWDASRALFDSIEFGGQLFGLSLDV